MRPGVAVVPDLPARVRRRRATARGRHRPRRGVSGGHLQFDEWHLRLRATGRLCDLQLAPLAASETGRLAAAISGRPLPADDVAVLHAVTGGFPLHVIEAARAGVQLGGDLAAVLETRVQQTGEAARAVAGLAAAVGTPFDLDLLVEASDLPAEAVVGAVDELWRQRILAEAEHDYDFTHDLLRDTAYALVSPPQRWLLHRRVAQAIELVHADNLDAVAARLADQYARGGRPDRAIGYYRRAASLATGVFASGEAVRLVRADPGAGPYPAARGGAGPGGAGDPAGDGRAADGPGGLRLAGACNA